MNDGGIHIVGDKQLIKQLQLLHDMGARTNNFRSVFQRASKPIKAAARAKAKSAFKTGQDRRNKSRGGTDRFKKSGAAYKTQRTKGPIWKSIAFLVSRKHKGVFWVGPTRGKGKRYDAYYAIWQERGTSHGIKPKLFMQKAYLRFKNVSRIIIKNELYKEIWKVAAKRSSI